MANSSSKQQQQITSNLIQNLQKGVSLTQVLQIALDQLHEALGVDLCYLTLTENNQQQIKIVSLGTSPRKELLNKFCLASNYHDERLTQQEIVFFADFPSIQPRALQSFAYQYDINSMLLVPIHYQKSDLGRICLYNCRPGRKWTKEEWNLVKAVASQSAIAIYQQQLQDKIAKQAEKEQLLSEIVQILGSDLDAEEILQKILWRIGETFNVDRVAVFHLKKDTVYVRQEWRISGGIPSLKGKIMDLSEWLTSLDPNYQRSGHFLTGNSDLVEFGEASLQPLQTRSTLNVPILVHNKLYGGLTVQILLEEREFDLEEISTIEKTAEYTAIALSRLHREQRLKQLELERQDHLIAYRTKDELLSQMSNEIRNPLTGIIGFTRLLQAQIHGSLNEKQLEYSKIIEQSSEQLLGLINDLIEISRLQNNREELAIETVLVKEVCLEVLALIPETQQKHKVQLFVDVQEDLLFCIADKQRLKQILINLLSNAIQFTQVGSVTLKVEQKRDEILFSIINAGKGLPAFEQNTPLESSHRDLVHQFKDTQLGLALSRKLAKLHNGEITIASDDNGGSCFTLHLPAMDIIG